MKILIACEFSGIARDVFIRAGHDAVSCDLLPTERPGPHIQGDVFEILDNGWDMMIGFHECTFLCNSGVRWLHEQEGRWEKMQCAANNFKTLLNADIEKIALENPIMHGYAKEIIGVQQSQTIQPWQFGHGEVKATCLWLKNLPLLTPTNIVDGREPRVHHTPPGPERWKERSRLLPGIAEAMTQWL